MLNHLLLPTDAAIADAIKISAELQQMTGDSPASKARPRTSHSIHINLLETDNAASSMEQGNQLQCLQICSALVKACSQELDMPQ